MNVNKTVHTSAAVRFKFINCILHRGCGESVLSQEVSDCNNNSWQLALYPGGFSSNPEKGFMSLCLINRKNPKKMHFSRVTFILRVEDGSVAFDISVDFSYSYKRDEVVVMRKSSESRYSRAVEIVESDLPKEGKEGIHQFVLASFIKRSKVLASNQNQSTPGWATNGDQDMFVIDAVIEANQRASSYYITPRNPLVRNILELLESGDLTDVSFEVEGEIVRAHKFILAVNAPLLADLCKEATDDSPVPMKGVSSDIFRRVLRYIYGEAAPQNEDEVTRIGPDLIDAANRFGLVELKLSVESRLVNSIAFNTSNVAGHIVFADAMTCPLLKERAVSYFVSRSRDVLKSEASLELRESAELMQELMIAVLDSKDEAFGKGNGYMGMPVETLWQKLNERKLQLDGSKEVLVARLRSYDKNKGRSN